MLGRAVTRKVWERRKKVKEMGQWSKEGGEQGVLVSESQGCRESGRGLSTVSMQVCL